MYKQKIIIFFFLVLLFKFSAFGQDKLWTLEECINHALENNLQICQQQLNSELSRVNVLSSKGLLLPNISGNATHVYNYGRTIDRYTNQFAFDMVQSNNFYASASITVFNGFQLLNSVCQREFELSASKYDLETIKNDISLTIATAFLQILYNREMVSNAEKQLEITFSQVERTQKLVDAGATAKSVLLNLEAQAATEEYQLVKLKNQLDLSYLSLAHILYLRDHKNFKIAIPEIDIAKESVPVDAGYIYEYALKNQPEIKSFEMRLESAKKGLSVSKGALSPSLTIGASIGTGYSGASNKIDDIQYTGYDTIGITTGIPPEYVLAQTFNYIYNPIPFNDQINDNFNSSVGFYLTIPIFNQLQTRTNISRSKINILIAETNLEQIKLTLYQTITQAHADADAALIRHQAAQKQLISAETAYKFAEERFEVGDITQVEYQDAKNRLIIAESELLQGKYEYVFKMKVLDFYLGKPIKLN